MGRRNRAGRALGGRSLAGRGGARRNPHVGRRNLAALRRVLADEAASTYQYLFVLSSDPRSVVPDSPGELGAKDTLLRVAAGR